MAEKKILLSKYISEFYEKLINFLLLLKKKHLDNEITN